MRPCWANQSTSCGPRASGRGTVSPLGPVGSGAGGRSRRSGAAGRRVGREADEHHRPAGYVNPVGEMPARSDRRRRCRSTTCTPPRGIHVLPRSHPLPESRPQRTAAAAATEPATLPGQVSPVMVSQSTGGDVRPPPFPPMDALKLVEFTDWSQPGSASNLIEIRPSSCWPAQLRGRPLRIRPASSSANMVTMPS